MQYFDTMRDVRFRGKPLDQLTHDETCAALKQALERVKYLEDRLTTTLWAPSVADGPFRPIPSPPRHEF